MGGPSFSIRYVAAADIATNVAAGGVDIANISQFGLQGANAGDLTLRVIAVLAGVRGLDVPTNPFGPRSVGLELPQGFTALEFQRFSASVRAGIEGRGLGSDIVVQGTRARGVASATSDVDIAIRVSPQEFQRIIDDPELTTLTLPLGPSNLNTRLRAIEEGIIQTGEARLSPLRNELVALFGFDVQISIVRIGGNFDNGPQSQLFFDFGN